MADITIICADAGSVARGNFGWYADISDGRRAEGTDIRKLSDLLISRLSEGDKVALGFECPLFVPLRNDPQELLCRRNGETNPNWIGGPGATVLATGLVELTWLLGHIRAKLNKQIPTFFDWNEFSRAQQGLFIWEAFVSGQAKGSSHVDDARIAVDYFVNSLPNPVERNAINEGNVISLAGAALLRSGWISDSEILSKPCLVLMVQETGGKRRVSAKKLRKY